MLQYKPFGEAVTVVIAGELDHFAAPQIRRMLDEVICDPAITDVELDLEAYRNVRYEPYDLKVLEGSIH